MGDRLIRLHDTAGMRRKARVQEKLEKLSVADGLRAIRFAEVVIIVLDATIPFEKQDLQIADLIIREGRRRSSPSTSGTWSTSRSSFWPNCARRPRACCRRCAASARSRFRARPVRGLDKLMQAVAETHEVWNRRISTGRLNRWLEGVLAHHPPPAVSGRRLKLRYATQIKTRPPGFVFSCSRPQEMPQSYIRYLTNELRETFDLPGIPIRISLRAGDNPYAHKARQKR